MTFRVAGLEEIKRWMKPCRVRRVLLFASDQPDFRVGIGKTLDKKMKTLPDRNAWIPVGDTKGINVWCAAG